MKKINFLLCIILFSSIDFFGQKYQIIPVAIGHNTTRYVIHDITIDNLGNIWAGTDVGVIEYNNEKWKLYAPAKRSAKNIKRIFIDSKNQKWCISFDKPFGNYIYIGGLFIIDSNNQVKTFPGTIEASIINDIIEDNEGNIWIATGAAGVGGIGNMAPGGVFMYDGIIMKNYSKMGIIPVKFVDNIIKTENDMWFMQQQDAGRYTTIKYDYNEFIELSKNEYWPGNYIYNITEVNDIIWFFSNPSFLFNIDSKGQIGDIIEVKPRCSWRGVFYNLNDKLFFIQGGRLLAYDSKNNTWVQPEYNTYKPGASWKSKTKKWIRNIAIDSEESYWLGTHGRGLLRYKNGAITKSDLLKGNSITFLHHNDDGSLLIGTYDNGFWLYSNNELSPLEHDSFGKKMPGACSTVKAENDEFIWITTSNGILKIMK